MAHATYGATECRDRRANLGTRTEYLSSPPPLAARLLLFRRAGSIDVHPRSVTPRRKAASKLDRTDWKFNPSLDKTTFYGRRPGRPWLACVP